MRLIITVVLGLIMATTCNAGIFKSVSGGQAAENVQVLAVPGKTPKTYNPNTGEMKDITIKVPHKAASLDSTVDTK